MRCALNDTTRLKTQTAEKTKIVDIRDDAMKAANIVKNQGKSKAEIIEAVSKVLISNYELILSTVKDVIESSSETKEKVTEEITNDLFDRLLTFENLVLKQLKSTVKLALLFYLFNVEELIQFVKNEGTDINMRKEQRELMRKHADLVDKLGLTADYQKLFAPRFNFDYLLPFLHRSPARLPKDLIKIIASFDCPSFEDDLQLILLRF